MPLARDAISEACANQRQRSSGVCVVTAKNARLILISDGNPELTALRNSTVCFFDVAPQIAACNRENRSMMSPFDNQL